MQLLGIFGFLGFCVPGFLKRNEPCMGERHMANCTIDWSCVCLGGKKVVCNGYTIHTDSMVLLICPHFILVRLC